MCEVSVITAAYNAAAFLPRYFESLKRQTFKDFELILIDDGSTDQTAGICDEFAKNSAGIRIVVIHKINGGVSSARNKGLETAKGKWIVFIDADDEVPDDSLESLITCADNKCDIVFAGYETISNGTIRSYTAAIRRCSMTILELARELFAPTDYPYQGYICSKLYRRSIIEDHHLRFNEKIKYNEDRLFTFSFLAYARGGVYTTKPVYKYYQHGGNAMAAIEGPDYWKFETDLDAFVEMCSIAPKYGSEELLRLVRKGTIQSYRWNKRLNRQYGGDYAETRKRLKEKLMLAVPLWFRCKNRAIEFRSLVLHRLNSIFHVTRM